MSMQKLLEDILSNRETSDEIVIYVLKERIGQALHQRYKEYESRLTDSFDDMQDDFFLYLREGRQGMDSMPYRMLHYKSPHSDTVMQIFSLFGKLMQGGKQIQKGKNNILL